MDFWFIYKYLLNCICYLASDVRVILNSELIEVKGSGHSLFEGTTKAFAWRNVRIPRNQVG
jgi:hypothetical protein